MPPIANIEDCKRRNVAKRRVVVRLIEKDTARAVEREGSEDELQNEKEEEKPWWSVNVCREQWSMRNGPILHNSAHVLG